MYSLSNKIEILENDLKANPPRISVYHDLPFAIFRYDPAEEWNLRREARLLATRLGEAGLPTRIIHMSELLWQAVQETEGIEAVVELEKERGFLLAQEQLTAYLSDRDWRPLTDLLSERLDALRDSTKIVFLMRVAAMSPGIYHVSKLLDQMQGRTSLLTILFYPGSIEGTTGLRFMDLKDREAWGNYRVKIYG
jgi:hypothetical protein